MRDIAMIAGLTRSAEVLEVNPALPIKSVSELIAYVKTNPGKLSLASFGTGTISHVAGVLFKREAGIEMVHVPYRGSAPLVVDLLAGQVPVAFDNIQSSIAYIKAGKLRALAVTSAMRLPWLPDVPVLGDFLPGYEVTGWIGVGAPKNTPRKANACCSIHLPSKSGRANRSDLCSSMKGVSIMNSCWRRMLRTGNMLSS